MSPAQHASPDLQQLLVQQQVQALYLHLADCREQCGRWQHAAAYAETAHRAVLPRFVTTVCLLGGVLALGLGWL